MSFSQEWAWAAGIIAIPVVVFGALEILMWVRRRRLDAVARRPKEARRQPESHIRSGRGA